MPDLPLGPVALDTMGGDRGPAAVVAGAVAAARSHGVRLILVGDGPTIYDLLTKHGAAGEMPIAHADETLSMDEGALASWRKPRSSIAICCRLIRSGQASAMVSAGTTAGVVSTARLRLRAQHGVMRPAIAVMLPTRPRPAVLLDAGATTDAKPEMLVQFAALGTAYAQVALDVPEPRVGLLTIGAEPAKGNRLTRRAHELLAATPLHFAGNVEGDELLSGRVDVIVTDGFTGNVALKSMEGAVRLAVAEVQAALTATRTASLAALPHRRRLRELGERLDSETYGGGVLLGLNGTVVIAHGDSNAKAIASACGLARDLCAGDIVERIKERVGATRLPRFGRRDRGDAAEPPRPNRPD
ncbi:MAG TPA: phosphate acyltransferase PlsX [Streptosporangiaceae bacterium]|nr:phosphate acyltransferase PlsX [Streptosporangiaceae bacterium]